MYIYRLLFLSFKAAREHCCEHREHQTHVPDGDDDKSKRVGAVVAEVGISIRITDILRGGAVYIHAAHHQPYRAEQRCEAVVHAESLFVTEGQHLKTAYDCTCTAKIYLAVPCITLDEHANLENPLHHF